ncbi:MAG: hypothetical protein WCI51_18570 [Lentisphaerota bacterium]
MRKKIITKAMFTFTLVELLVIIAIIVILASMLLPALNKARMSAQISKCANNLKQAGIYVQMYASDNKEIIILNPLYMGADWTVDISALSHMLVLRGKYLSSKRAQAILVCPMDISSQSDNKTSGIFRNSSYSGRINTPSSYFILNKIRSGALFSDFFQWNRNLHGKWPVQLNAMRPDGGVKSWIDDTRKLPLTGSYNSNWGLYQQVYNSMGQ